MVKKKNNDRELIVVIIALFLAVSILAYLSASSTKHLKDTDMRIIVSGDATILLGRNSIESKMPRYWDALMLDCGTNPQHVLDILKKNNVSEIWWIIGSDPTMENIGGCAEIVKQKKVITYVSSGDELLEKTQQAHNLAVQMVNHSVTYHKVNNDESWETFPAGFNYHFGMALLTGIDTKSGLSGGDRSVLLEVQRGKFSALFQGDCTMNCQIEILRTRNTTISTTITKNNVDYVGKYKNVDLNPVTMLFFRTTLSSAWEKHLSPETKIRLPTVTDITIDVDADGNYQVYSG